MNDYEEHALADRLEEYLDETLSEEEMQKVLEQLKTDAKAREVLVDVLAVRGLLKLAADPFGAHGPKTSSQLRARRILVGVIIIACCIAGLLLYKCVAH